MLLTPREVRTEQVGCITDTEYISKVHCVRLASHYLFSQRSVKMWFVESGRQIIAHLMVRANKVRGLTYFRLD